MWRDVWYDVRYRVRAFIHRDAAECDLDAEIEDHLAREAEALERSGLSPADARRQARLAFGGLEGTRERTRDAWGTSVLDSVVQDVRYAVRGLSARPAFSLGITLTLALGIGANAAMLGIVDRLLFRPPPYLTDTDLVHRVYLSRRSRGTETFQRSTSIGRLLDIARGTKSFSSIAAVATQRRATGDGVATRGGSSTGASAGVFRPVRRVPAHWTAVRRSRRIGFRRGSPVAVLGYGYWTRRLAPGPTSSARSCGSAGHAVHDCRRGAEGYSSGSRKEQHLRPSCPSPHSCGMRALRTTRRTITGTPWTDRRQAEGWRDGRGSD